MSIETTADWTGLRAAGAVVRQTLDPRQVDVLSDGLVLTIEPMVRAGSARVVQERDGWTLRTEDRSLSAHHEHTLLITSGAPVLLT